MFPQLAQFTDLSLLLLRLMVASVFVTSGMKDLRDPKGRSESIGLGRRVILFIGAAEIAGGLGVAAGVLIQLAAIGLMVIMAGAIHRRIFIWHSDFWGTGSNGWHYDLMLLIMNIVIACTAGGRYVLVG